MNELPNSLNTHRVRVTDHDDVCKGRVRWAPAKSLWFLGMAIAAGVGGAAYFSWSAFAIFLTSTSTVLLFGHSLGSHRKLIHNSFQCPRWLERLLIYFGVQVGLAGPIGLLRQHELRDFAQRLPQCHDYLRHGRSFWLDAWWQLNCELRFDRPPVISLESRITDDRFLQWLERTWMLQQIPIAVLFYGLGGWGWVFWGVCARVTAGVFGHWLIGYFAHNHGGMHYEVKGAAVQGHNVPFAWLLTMGECWHNNHHAFPGSARLGLFPGERDPGWWALMLFGRMGLAWGFRLPNDLPPRPELIPRDELSRTTGDDPSEPDVLRWPGATLPLWLLRAIAGNTPVLLDRTSRRLTFHGKTGLPALCTAMARQGGIRSIFAGALLGVAEAFERARQRWEHADQL